TLPSGTIRLDESWLFWAAEHLGSARNRSLNETAPTPIVSPPSARRHLQVCRRQQATSTSRHKKLRSTLVVQELPQSARIEVPSDQRLNFARNAQGAIFVSVPRSCTVPVVNSGRTDRPVNLLILGDRRRAWDRLEFDPTIQSIAGIVLASSD